MEAELVDRFLLTLGVTIISPPVGIKGGWSGSSVWRVELDSGPHLVRQMDFPFEPEVLERCNEADFPAPRCVACRTLDGQTLMLLDWLEGQSVQELLIKFPDLSGSCGEQAGQLMASLHQLDSPPSLPWSGDWPSPDAIPSQLRTVLEHDVRDQERLLHLDYHPGNLIIDRGRVSGVIDWTNARRGDPRFDIARSYLIVRLLPAIEPASYEVVRSAIQQYLAGWRRGYRLNTGSVTGIIPYMAWAAWGTLHDLKQKPEHLIPSESLPAFCETIAHLERIADRWTRLVT